MFKRVGENIIVKKGSSPLDKNGVNVSGLRQLSKKGEEIVVTTTSVSGNMTHLTLVFYFSSVERVLNRLEESGDGGEKNNRGGRDRGRGEKWVERRVGCR